MRLKTQFRDFYDMLKANDIDSRVDELLQLYWFSWSCPKTQITKRSKRIANQLIWLIRSPLIQPEWHFELKNVEDGLGGFYDEIRFVNSENKNKYILTFSDNFNEDHKIELWCDENEFEFTIAQGYIEKIKNVLKIDL